MLCLLVLGLEKLCQVLVARLDPLLMLDLKIVHCQSDVTQELVAVLQQIANELLAPLDLYLIWNYEFFNYIVSHSFLVDSHDNDDDLKIQHIFVSVQRKILKERKMVTF